MMDYLLLSLKQLLIFAALPGSGPGQSAGAGSLFSNYTASVAIYAFLAGVLATVLVIGALVLVNIGMLSKRQVDRIGGRTPSDPGILRENIWPEGPYEENELPAEEEDQQESGSAKGNKREVA